MKDRLIKLIDVKTIVTFAITGLFCYLGVIGKISADKVWEAFLIIIGFYFGTQQKKLTSTTKEDEK
jgi:hypothetical protein